MVKKSQSVSMSEIMNRPVTIQELPVDINAKLPPDARKALAEIIDNEFKNRVQVDYQKKSKAVEAVIQKHKELLRIPEKMKAINKLYNDFESLKKEVRNLGFSDSGNYCRGQNPVIEKEIDELEKTSTEITTLKNKLLSRLMLSTTIGEATVIMKEIMGNNVIPCVKQNAISFDK